MAVTQSLDAERPPAPKPRRRGRVVDAIIGHPATRRLALTHAIDDFADSMVNLSLVGSLFFSVSLEASRTRILLYLLLTAAPLAIVAPAVGPLLDRMRAGYRAVITGSQLARAGLALAFAGALTSLAFYPLVFGILLSRKAYALARTTVVAQLVPDRNELAAASGHLARTGTIAGGVGTAVAGVLILTVGVEWVPIAAGAGFLAAAAVSSRVAIQPLEARTPGVIVRAETPVDVKLATLAVGVVRAAAGALTYLLALAIKRGGGDEWIFAAALLAAGIGTFVGTMVAPRLHRALSSDRIVAFTLLVPGAVSAFGTLTLRNFSIIAIAFSIGLGGSVASRAMDVLYGRVPQLVRGRAVALSQLIFQLANVAGAGVAVLTSPSPRAGFAVVALALIVGGVAYGSRIRLSLRHEAGSLLLGRGRVDNSAELPQTLLDEAVHHAERGNHTVSIALADTAARISIANHPDRPTPERSAWEGLSVSVEAIVMGRQTATADLAVAVISTARALVDRGVHPSERTEPSSSG